MGYNISAEWASLAEPWKACFLQAWDAFVAGSVPVGAVVVDPAGVIVCEGRNRRRDATAPAGHLANTTIAHAELNTCAQLPPGDYWDHTMYTTLEPCLLCTAAMIHTHIGTVRYAAADPLWLGLDQLPQVNGHISGVGPGASARSMARSRSGRPPCRSSARRSTTRVILRWPHTTTPHPWFPRSCDTLPARISSTSYVAWLCPMRSRHSGMRWKATSGKYLRRRACSGTGSHCRLT